MFINPKRMKFLSFNAGQYLAFSVCLLLTLAMSGCQKERLEVSDLPFEQLESSFYKLSPETIEIDHQDLVNQIISKDTESIVFNNSESIDQLQVGSILVSSLDAPSSEFICRKVLAKNVSGNRIEFMTERATIVQAYDSYYFNSEKSNLVQLREESLDIKDLFDDIKDPLNAGLNTLWGSAVGVGDLEFTFGFVGTMAFEAIHPNTFYEFACGCIPDTTDNDENSIWDEVERELEINEAYIADVMDLGFYTAKLNQFGIGEMSLKVTFGSVGISATDLDPGFNATSTASILAEMKETDLSTLSEDGSALNLYHVPTPITVGAVSVFFSAGPLIEISGKMSGFIGATLASPSRIDIQFGHVNLYKILRDPNLSFSDLNPAEVIIPDVKILGGGQAGDVFSDLVVHGQVGGNGSATMKLGANIGLSAGGGEATLNGFAAGIVAPVGIEASLNGVGTATMQLYPFDYNSLAYHGEICGDIKAGILDIKTFSDLNISGVTVDNYFDVAISLADLSIGVPDLSLSLLQGADNYTSNGICFRVTSCDDFVIERMNVGIDANNNLNLEFKILNEQPTNYTLAFRKKDGTEIAIPGTYEMGTLYKNIPWITSEIQVLAGILVTEGDFVVISTPLNCEKKFPASDVNVVSQICSLPFELSTASNQVYNYTNAAGQSISYYKYDESETYPSLGAITNLIANITTCNNTSGFFIKDASGFKYGNANKNYAFVNESGTDQLLVYTIEFDGNGQPYCDCNFDTFSEDIYAPKLK